MVKLLLIVFVMFSQLVANDDLSAYKSLKSLENTLESQIRNELKLYTSSPFNVGVTVVLDEIQTTKASPEKQSLPGLYQQNSTENTEDDQLLKNELNHIEVLITLDTGVDPSIVSLAKKIAYEKANLSDRRGDKVTVVKKALQVKKKKLEVSNAILDKIQQLDEQITGVDAKNQERLKNSERDFQNKLDLAKNEISLAMKKNNDTITVIKENSLYLFLLILVAFIIFSYLVFIYFSNLSKKDHEHVKELETKLDRDIDAVKNDLHKTIEEIDTNKTAEVDQRLINDLATLVIARKNAVKAYIKTALHSPDGEEKVALLAQVLGTKSMSALLFKEENLLNDVMAIVNQHQFKPQERESLAQDLYKELLNKTNNQDNQEFDEFAFVKNMNINQLLLLLEGEDIGIQAFILTQIENVVSAEVLSRLDENLRLNLLIELSNMHPINAQTYSAISKKLSSKIANSPKVNHFVLDGESEMATQILYLKPKDQTAMLNKILTQDTALYNRIKEKYIFAEDVDKLEKSLVKTLLFTLNDLDLSLSLYQFGKELQQKLLAEVSERKMVIIDEKIKQFEEENPSTEKMSVALYNFLNEANKIKNKSI